MSVADRRRWSILATAIHLPRIESVDLVADLVGVVPETIYNHFSGLAGLIRAVETVRSLPGGPGAQINTYLAEHYTVPVRRQQGRARHDRAGNRRVALMAAMEMVPPALAETTPRPSEIAAWERSVPTVAAIGQRAGVSAAVVHGNFGGKAELIEAVMAARALPGDPDAQADAYLAGCYVEPVAVAGGFGPRDKARPRDHLGHYVNAECAVCGEPFYRDYPTRDVCSSACSIARGTADGRWRLPGPRCKFPSCPNRVNATCVICGELFHAHRQPGGRISEACGRKCGVLLRRQRYGSSGRHPMTADQRIEAYFRRRGAWPSTAVRWLPCAWCGEQFISRLGTLTCSEPCRRKRANRYTSDSIMRRYYSEPWFRDRVISQAQNRRASRLGLEGITEPRELTLFLLERDGNVCGICGGTVLDERGPRQASADHVIPLARGGAHTVDNLQLAHLDCNLSKSDKIVPSVLGYPGERVAAA